MTRDEPIRAVGVCLAADGAVIAVVHSGPVRLAAIATVTWPAMATSPAATAAPADARRMLTRARRQLRLPRWQTVAIVLAPDLAAAGESAAVLPRGAMARAGLVQGWAVAAPDALAHVHALAAHTDARAAHADVWAAHTNAALVDKRHELAAGAALSALHAVYATPAVAVLPDLTSAPVAARLMPVSLPQQFDVPQHIDVPQDARPLDEVGRQDETQPRHEVRPWAGAGGWAVERVPDAHSSLATPRANT